MARYIIDSRKEPTTIILLNERRINQPPKYLSLCPQSSTLSALIKNVVTVAYLFVFASDDYYQRYPIPQPIKVHRIRICGGLSPKWTVYIISPSPKAQESSCKRGWKLKSQG